MSRREQLEAMLESDPADTFLRYALAMELDNEGEHDRSLELYQGLIGDATPYVPAFFMSGQQLARLGREDQAREILTAGIDEAQRQGDLHAAGEMREFLASLG